MPLEHPPTIPNDRDLDDWLIKLYYSFVLIDGDIIEISDTGVGADTEFSVSHGLARIPNHVEILVSEGQTDAYLSIRPGSTAWTDQLIYLDCSSANAALTIKVW